MSIDEHLENKIKEVFNKLYVDEYLSLKQVEQTFGCSRTWVYRQHANGHLRIYKFGGKSRVKKSEIEALGVAL